MAVTIDQILFHSTNHINHNQDSGLPQMSLNSQDLNLIPPSHNYYNEKFPTHIQVQHHEKHLLRHKLSKKLNMKRSFHVNNIKNSNSIDSHPLIDNSNNNNDNDINKSNDAEVMETDDYDSDDLSCNSSCLSTPSKSDFSFLFDSHNHQPPSSSSTSSIPMIKPPSYSNASILSSLTGSGISLAMSVGSPSPSTRSYISTSSTTVSCSPITTVPIPISTSTITTSTTGNNVTRGRRRKSLCRTPSSDSLYVILKKSTPNSSSPLGTNSNVKSVYSNLTSSFKTFKNKLPFYNKDNIINYILDSPRLTDDKLPQIPESESESDQEIDDVVNSMQELTTFKCSGTHHCYSSKLGLARIKFKAREQRSNRDFLRLYALDRNARFRTLTLPNCISSEEVKRIIKIHPHMKKFHHKFNIYRISNLSKDKLWSSVILPPRNDESPELSINGENYVYNDDEEVNAEVVSSYSLVRKQGGYMPWSLKQSIKPAGILPKSPCLFNSEAPNSGVTNCQFTVKGWCNPRWIDHGKN